MDLETLDWDDELLDALGVPRGDAARDPLVAPRSTARRAGRSPGCRSPRALGDQQAALFGQTCFAARRGQVHLRHRQLPAAATPASSPVPSANGLLTTVGYRIGDEPPTYALEGSIAVTGALVQWFRDNLGADRHRRPRSRRWRRTVDDNGGCYFVPAFSGLFAPHWRSDARGVIAGLTGYITKGHLARAVLEATAWQTREVVDAMNADAGVRAAHAARRRRHDRQQPADAVPRRRARRAGGAPDRSPRRPALGAAYAAGLAVGFWPDTDALRANWHKAAEWLPQMDEAAARARLPQVAQGGRRGRWTGSTTTTEGCPGAGLPPCVGGAAQPGHRGKGVGPARPRAVVLGANQSS